MNPDYTEDLRVRAVKECLASLETPISVIADRYDIHRESLRVWVRNAQQGAGPPYTRAELARVAVARNGGAPPVVEPERQTQLELEESGEEPAPDTAEDPDEPSAEPTLGRESVPSWLPEHVAAMTIGEVLRLSIAIGRHEREVDSWRKRAHAAAQDAKDARAETRRVRRDFEQRIAKFKAGLAKAGLKIEFEGL